MAGGPACLKFRGGCHSKNSPFWEPSRHTPVTPTNASPSWTYRTTHLQQRSHRLSSQGRARRVLQLHPADAVMINPWMTTNSPLDDPVSSMPARVPTGFKPPNIQRSAGCHGTINNFLRPGPTDLDADVQGNISIPEHPFGPQQSNGTWSEHWTRRAVPTISLAPEPTAAQQLQLVTRLRSLYKRQLFRLRREPAAAFPTVRSRITGAGWQQQPCQYLTRRYGPKQHPGECPTGLNRSSSHARPAES